MPKVGTKEYEDLAKETGGRSTLAGFDYKAHIAATSKREFLSDGIDSLTGQANFDKALMGGDDFLEVTGGVPITLPMGTKVPITSCSVVD